MSVTTEPSAALLRRMQSDQHPRCVVCGECSPASLGLEFDVRADGSVAATFACAHRFEGYNGMLHGGVISAIADGAMTNCLFAHGVRAVTGELTVRFRHPIALGRSLEAVARLTRVSAPLYVAEARLLQEGEVKVIASGKFMETPKGENA